MADPETDVFGFTAEGFHTSYSRLTRPPTREERLAALDANRSDLTETKAAAAVGIVSETAKALGVAVPAPAADAPAPDNKVEEVKKLSKEDRDAYLTAIFAVQYENGEYATPAIPDSDGWDE